MKNSQVLQYYFKIHIVLNIILFTAEELNGVQSDFRQNRAKYPALFIVTPYDELKSLFTLNSPTEIILKRVRVLALETFKYSDNCIMGPGALHVKVIIIF